MSVEVHNGMDIYNITGSFSPASLCPAEVAPIIENLILILRYRIGSKGFVTTLRAGMVWGLFVGSVGRVRIVVITTILEVVSTQFVTTLRAVVGMVRGLFVGCVGSVRIVVVLTILEMMSSCLLGVIDLSLRVVGGIVWGMIMDGIGMVLIVVVTCGECSLGNGEGANAACGC